MSTVEDVELFLGFCEFYRKVFSMKPQKTVLLDASLTFLQFRQFRDSIQTLFHCEMEENKQEKIFFFSFINYCYY